MAALAPGILLKLIDGIHSGVKPNGEHRSALLQVTDIVPVDVDQKELWPKHGFYVKISDSSHSIYASLPFDQDDLILSNKIQLGQFMYVDKLEPGSPVPIIKGAKPIPGRHPLVGTPEPITRIKSNGGKVGIEKVPSHYRRGSWAQDQNAIEPGSSPCVVKPITLDFDHSTPMKDATGSNRKGSISASPLVRGRLNKELLFRSSVSGMVPKMAELKGEVPTVRKSCIGPPSASKIPRSKSTACEREEKMPQTPIKCIEEKKSTTPPPRFRRTEVSFTLPEEDSKSIAASRSKSQTHNVPSRIYTNQSTPVNVTPPCNSGNMATLPGKLNMIGKEVIQQREATQKVALQALRDASASETLVRVLNMFSELCRNAKSETPSSCFDQFLGFHQEIAQAIRDMESVQAAANVLLETVREPEREASVLHEIAHNSIDQPGNHFLNNTMKRRNAVSKPTFEKNDPGSRSTNTKKAGDRKLSNESEATQNFSNYNVFTNAIRLGKHIETEAGNWFMEFVDEALETGLKKPKGSASSVSRKSSSCCPQSLILKVINWLEVEQSDASKRPVHPRAAQIARKLRIKAKNP